MKRDMLREMDMFNTMYGYLPDVIEFKGNLGKVLYELIKKKKLWFANSMRHTEYFENVIVMIGNREIVMQEDKAHDFGLIYTKETKMKPRYEVKIYKY